MFKLTKPLIITLSTLISFSVYASVTSHPKNEPIPMEQSHTVVSTPEEKEDEPLSGYLTFVTNYVFRGITNSNNTPAVQGSLTYTFPMGIYFNLWGSNVDLIAPNEDQATIELDTIVGVTNDIGEHFNYNLSYARYNYPKARQLEYNEAIANFTFYFLTATIAYSANEYNVGKPGTYYSGGVIFDLSFIKGLENGKLTATAGHFQLPREAGPSYDDYSVTLSKEIKNYVLAVQWTDTNHKFYNNSFDHSFVIGSVTANF